MAENRKKKTCSRCLEEKHTHSDPNKSDFFKEKRTADGFRYECKACHKQAKAVAMMRKAMELGGLI